MLPGQSSSVTTSLGVLSNDFDVDGDTLTASMASTTANGTTTLASDGSFTYDPGLFVGTESFIYTVSDGSLTATGTVILSQGPTWLMSVDKNEVDEDESTITVTITLINASSTRASIVDLITVDGTATAPSDYGALSQQITLGGAFGTSTPVLITIANDPVREGDETFVVKLLNARPGSDTIAASVISGEVSGAFSISLTIDDPQDAPTVAVADATVSEGDVAQVVVTVTGKTFLTTTVIYRTMQTSSANALLAAVEASALDYQGISSGALTFGPNTTTPSAAQSIVVTTTEDTIDELDEIFAVDICGCSDSQRDGSSGVAPLTTTRDVAIVTITDDDDAPSLAIANQKARESAGTATITVTLEGGSSGGVTTTVITTASTTAVTTASATVTTTVVSSAEAGKDYQATTAVLTWAPNETGTKTFTVNVIDDAIEEDLESVILLITGTTTATSTLGVTVSDGIAKLRITNDELAAKVVGITSDSEAMPGDWFFLVVASSTGSSVNVSSTGGLVSGTLMDIDSIDDIVRGMHGLNTVRTKRSTHAWLYMVPTSSQMLGTVNFEFGTGGTFNLTSTADAAISLKIVGSRGNRNFFLSPGINFTGLGLVPVTSSVADLLKQKVASDVYPAFAEAVAVANNDNFTRGVWLQDVIETIFVFKFDAAGGWNSFHTADPLSGVSGTDPATGLMTNIKPFQGMIIKTRQKAGDKGQTVFAMVSHGNLGTVGVPIKMNVVGPFIDVTTNAPLAPPEQQLRFGWNLVAPHTQEAAPFNVVFNDVLVPERLASRAISFIREVQAGDFGSSIVGAVVEEFAIATWNEIIRPEFAYWVRINQPSAGTATPITPTIGPAGADGGT